MPPYEMPPVINRHRKIPNLGHRFLEELRCKCGTAWADHIACPLPCQYEHPAQPFQKGTLASALRTHQVLIYRLADKVGCSRETARKAIQGCETVDADTREAVTTAAVAALRRRGIIWTESVTKGVGHERPGPGDVQQRGRCQPAGDRRRTTRSGGECLHHR